MPKLAERETWYRVRRIDLEIKPVVVSAVSQHYVTIPAGVDGWRRDRREARMDTSGVIVRTRDEAVAYARQRIESKRDAALRSLSEADEQMAELLAQIDAWKEEGDA